MKVHTITSILVTSCRKQFLIYALNTSKHIKIVSCSWTDEQPKGFSKKKSYRLWDGIQENSTCYAPSVDSTPLRFCFHKHIFNSKTKRIVNTIKIQKTFFFFLQKIYKRYDDLTWCDEILPINCQNAHVKQLFLFKRTCSSNTWDIE